MLFLHFGDRIIWLTSPAVGSGLVGKWFIKNVI